MRNLWSKIKTRLRWSRIKSYALDHKIISFIIILVIVFAGYKIYGYFTNTSGETHYVIAAVQKGTIISTVSGSGQVSASQQVELKPKASGDIVYLGAKSGQMVSQGQLLAQIDTRDAAISLASAKLNLQKAVEANRLTTGGLAKNSEDSLTNVNKTFLDLPTVIEGLNSVLNNYQVSVYKINLPSDKARSYYDKAKASYYQSLAVYQKTLADYQNLNRLVSDSSIKTLTQSSYSMLQTLSLAMKDANTYINFVYDSSDSAARPAAMVTDRDNINAWSQTINADLTTISSNLETMRNSSLDIQTQKLAVQQQENNYADYFIYAPFTGMVQINVNVNDSASGGTSLGTIVSTKKIATVSLNEVDIAKVKVGQKATLTFDAIEGLSIAGEVAEVDIVGTISQGVVNYNAKISFDTQDERIKSGMSASASIVVAAKQDVLVVPSGVVKTQANSSYVLVVDRNTAVTGNSGIVLTKTPAEQLVTVGLSDDTLTEIVSGLTEGDKVVSRTIAGTATPAAATSQTPSLFGGGNRSAGGAVRIPGAGGR